MFAIWRSRILSALIAAAVTGLLALGVNSAFPPRPRFDAGKPEAGITYEVTGIPSDRIVVSVDGNGAPMELLTYWAGTYASYINDYLGIDVEENWDTEFEGMTLEQTVREEALTMLRQELVLENACARCGVTLSEEDEKALAAQRAQYVDSLGGEEAYRAELYKLGITPEGYDRLSRTDFLYSALYRYFCDPGSQIYADDALLARYAADNGWITADHILFATQDPATGEERGEEEKAEKKRLAEETLRQLRDSADPAALFAELADRYSEDPGRAANPRGYTFTYGTMVEPFDEAARALGENEISDIVESSYGYHIILRRPLDEQQAAESVRADYFDTHLLADPGDAAEVDPVVDAFDIRAVWKALREAQSQ